MQCRAKTKQGRRCHNNAVSGQKLCSVHRNSKDSFAKSPIKGAAVGAALGMMIPGVGLVATGLMALLGAVLEKELGEGVMQKKRVFVSFDFDNDRALKDFIVGQAKNPDSPIEIINHSLKEAAPERTWETKAQQAIARSEIVIVMLGQHTHKAQGVLKEIRMARQLGRKIVQIIGYKNVVCPRIPDAGQVYHWNWQNLGNLLS